ASRTGGTAGEPPVLRGRCGIVVAHGEARRWPVTGVLSRSLVRQYLATLAAVWVAVVAIFLVADFVDRARMYSGPDWIRDVLILYGYKGSTVFHQLSSVAILLAAGVCASAVRKRGEWTALKSLGFSSRALLLPIGIMAAIASVSLVAFDEHVAVDAA